MEAEYLDYTYYVITNNFNRYTKENSHAHQEQIFTVLITDDNILTYKLSSILYFSFMQMWNPYPYLSSSIT